MKQVFFLRGQLVGQAERGKSWVHEELSCPNGTAFFCPICSEVWLNAPIEGVKTFVLHLECELHSDPDAYMPPGSFTIPWDDEWNKALPPELLKRELLILIEEAQHG